MKLKFILISLLIILLNINIYGQYTWPIKDLRAGKGIIYKPQDLIENELNFDNLFISAEYGSEVIAPESGKITFFAYKYLQSLTYSFVVKVDYKSAIKEPNYDNQFRKLLASRSQVEPKFISTVITVETKDGERYSISGLRPTKFLKTGSYIKKGDVIGKVAYAYKKISKPCISFSISKNAKSVDPMGVFGLTTTFISPDRGKQKQKQKEYLTHLNSKKELIEDFDIFCQSLKEGHPGLYDYISRAELQKKMDDTRKELKPMTSEEFRMKLASIISLIRDSHTGIYSSRYKLTDGSRPPILFGLDKDSVVVYSSIPEFKNYIGKKIIRIDNRKIENILPKINSFLYGNDGYIKTFKERKLFVWLWKYYGEISRKNKNDTINIMFSNGATDKFIYDNYKPENYAPFLKQPFNDSIKVLCKKLTSDIGLLKINDFCLNDVERYEIRDFIKSISDSSYKGLIVDVRDNLGGSDEILNETYSYIAQKPWRQTLYFKVNKKGTYELFKQSVNFPPEMKLFLNFVKSDDGKSFVLPKDSIPVNYPNDSVNFRGKVVVLANEFSLSAATLLPAFVHKQNRGVIIGRETGSGYYQMNAIHFPEINLKNTGLELYFPLEQVIFEEKGNSDIPWGRGVIPDITIPLSYAEFSGQDESFLKIAKDLIYNEDNEKHLSVNSIALLSVSFLVMLLIILFIIKRKKN